MKYLLISLMCLTITNSFAQKIYFAIENGKIVTEQELVKLKLPIDLNFNKANFNDKNVEIIDDSNKVIALQKGKFGQNDLTVPEGDSIFTIQILADGKINPATKGDVNLKDTKKFKLKIEGFDPIVLSFNVSSSVEKTSEDAYKPGYIYYDAIKLITLDKEYGTIKKILAFYGINSSNYESNSFIKDVFGDIIKKGGDQAGGSLLTNLGNTDVTYFAEGLARFLAERTKEELNEAFFSRMKEQLNSYPELKTAFPKTASFLDIIETYSYASVIQVLKEAFETDIQNLPENLYNLTYLDSTKCNKDDKKCKDRMDRLVKFFENKDGRWLAFGLFTAKEAVQSTNPAELLNSISKSDEIVKLKKTCATKGEFHLDYNIASSIELSNIISQSLISKTENQVWITPKQLDSLLTYKQGKAFEVYLGLLLSFEQREKDPVIIKFYKSDTTDSIITFGKILVTAKGNYDVYKPQIVSLIKNSYTVYNATNNAVKKIIAASEKSTEVEPQALYNYYKTLTASLKPIAHSPLLNSLIKKDFGAKFDTVEKFLTPSVDITYHISTKKYSAAIYDASILLSSLDTVLDDKKNPVFKPITKSFVKYGTLISTVANAQTSEEVKQALEASVLPVGSYSIKQNSRASFSINSYVGAYYSFSETKSIPKGGLIAPIGFNFSQGVKKDNFFNKYLLMGGYSINLQFLDLGALVNYYLIKGDTATVPNDFNIKLSNIFSPGISVNYNIKKTPLSLAFGTQYIPTLYKYEQINGVNQLIPTNAWRWQISLLVDISLYNLKVWDFKK